MIIGIDGNEANTQKRVGIGQYAFNLMREFYTILNNERKSKPECTIYLKAEPLDDLPKANDLWRYKIIGPKLLWTQLALPFQLSREHPSPDVFFTPSHYAPRFGNCKCAISVMDVSYLHYPEMFNKKDLYQLTSWTSYSVKKAECVFTISQHSKKTIIESYGIDDRKVIVTYPGYNEELYTKNKAKAISFSDLKKKYGIRSDYILFVGTLQPRKNIERLLEAFELLKEKQSDVQLLIVGKKGWLFEGIFKKVEALNLKEDVIFADFVPDEEMPSIYAHARCLVLPSLYEGFGLPVIEAMACGCPVVVSNSTSLPEIVGKAGILIDPVDTESITEGMKKAGLNSSLRDDMIQKGLTQCQKFHWRTCAQQTLDELQRIALS